jgi:hypothetical protein
MSIHRQNIEQPRAGERLKILFLAVNPEGTGELAVGRELAACQRQLAASSHRDCYDLETRFSAEPLDLMEALRQVKPHILHVSGHGFREPTGKGKGGFVFQGKNGAAQRVSWRAVADAILVAGDRLRFALLNACYSDHLAKKLCKRIDVVIGTRGLLAQDDAINFARGAYLGLGSEASMAATYHQGCAAIGLTTTYPGGRPKMRVRQGVDPNVLYLTNGRCNPKE